MLLVLLIAGAEISLPGDLGAWVPAALPGEAVFVLASTTGGLLVGSGHGLHLLAEDGSLQDLGVDGRVNALLPEPGSLLVGTENGLVGLPAPGAGPEPGRLPHTVTFDGVDVQALAAGPGTIWAGTATGLHRRAPDGRWQRLWPAAELPGQSVPAVLAVDGGVLFAHPDGLARLDEATDTVSLVRPGVSVIALLGEPDGRRLWAGLRGDPLLLCSDDQGRTWEPRSRGLGFTAVNDVAIDPSVPHRLLVGGSGLADGTGNAGIQTSDDGGLSWQATQGQLSNTHVFALLGRQEPVRLDLRLAGVTGTASLPLPVTSGRAYAGTNGGGVYTHRPTYPFVELLGRGRPVLRLLEPLLAGLLLLACFAPAYQRLARADRGARSSRRTSANSGDGLQRPTGDD